MRIGITKEGYEILREIEDYRKKNNLPSDEKIKPLSQIEIDFLPKLPNTWSWVISNDISTFITNGVHSPTSATDELGINKRMLRITDIGMDGNVNFNLLPYCKRFVKGDYDKTLRKNDLYISFTGNVLGKRYLVKESNDDIVFAHYFVRWQPLIVNPKFIYYVLLSFHFERFMHEHTLGSTQPNMKVTELKRVPLPLPPLPEQKAISLVLSSLDDKIDLLHRQNKTLEAMVETLFRQWFVEESEEEWPIVKIGDFVRTNVYSVDKYFNVKNIRYLDTGSLTQGKIEGYQNIAFSDAPSRARRIVKHNDILISTVRPNQKHYGILKHPEDDIVVSTGFCVITCDKINPHFIYTYLTTNDMTEYLHTIAEGSTSTYPSLKPSDIENLEFQIPSEYKLSAFSEYAESAWDKIDYNHKQICILEKIRDTLIPKLMSGEIKVAV